MNKKVCFVTDPLYTYGGAEYMLEVMSEIYPDAPIFTAVSEPEFISEYFPDRTIVNSFVDRLPFERDFRKEYMIFYPKAYQSFDFREFDVVISISSAFAKMIKVPKGTTHINICLTPPRFLWMDNRSTKDSEKLSYKIYETFGFVRKALHNHWRKLDVKYAHDADVVVAISEEVARRIRKFYQLNSEVIYPPVEVSEISDFSKQYQSDEEWFLFLGRLESYKGADIAVKACIESNSKLKLAGKGSQLERLKELVHELGAADRVQFLGFVDHDKKMDLLSRARALIYPVKDEDFGIVPVEANAAGTPVIAYRGGGAIETLSEKNPKSALFFNEMTVESLSKAVEDFDKLKFDADNCRKQAGNFARELFEYKIKNLIDDV